MGWVKQQECIFPSSAFGLQVFLREYTDVCFWFALATDKSIRTLSPSFPPVDGTRDDDLGFHGLDYVPPMAQWQEKDPDVRYDFIRCVWEEGEPGAGHLFSWLLKAEMVLPAPPQDSGGSFHLRLRTFPAYVGLTSPRPDECIVQLWEDDGLVWWQRGEDDVPVWDEPEQPVEQILTWGLTSLINYSWNLWLLFWQRQPRAGQSPTPAAGKLTKTAEQSGDSRLDGKPTKRPRRGRLFTPEGERRLACEYWQDRDRGLMVEDPGWYPDPEDGRRTQEDWAEAHAISLSTLKRILRRHPDLKPNGVPTSD